MRRSPAQANLGRLALFVPLAACATVATGDVRGAADAPLVGARLHASGVVACDGVSDATGRFSVPCARGTYEVTVTHPACLPWHGSWTVSGVGEAPVGTAHLLPLPEAPGVHILTPAGFVAPAALGLDRTGTATEGYAWCLTDRAGLTEIPAGEVRLLDNHIADWRLYRADDKGCVYRMTPSPGGYWSHAEDAVPLQRGDPWVPGRDWLTATLPAGDYALVDTVAAAPVPDGGRWRATWVRAR